MSTLHYQWMRNGSPISGAPDSPVFPEAPAPVAQVDPELTRLGRFLAWLGLGQAVATGTIEVRIACTGRGGWSLFPANDAARALMGAGETGNFPTAADARKRAAWNCWEVVE